MAELNAYRDFRSALRRHWKSVMPHVVPLKEGRVNLPKASTFYAGESNLGPIHVYLHFQTHSNIGGRFTINVVLAHEDLMTERSHKGQAAVAIGRFQEGPNRIGRFLKLRHGDRWWHLSPEKVYGWPGNPLSPLYRNEDFWYPPSFDDPNKVTLEAVSDVTFCVHIALTQLGVPGARRSSAE